MVYFFSHGVGLERCTNGMGDRMVTNHISIWINDELRRFGNHASNGSQFLSNYAGAYLSVYLRQFKNKTSIRTERNAIQLAMG